MSLNILLADWIVPISSPPLKDGAIVIQDEVILDFGIREDIIREYSGTVSDCGKAVIVPAWVNAHCHLELSDLYPVEHKSGSFVEWVRQIVYHREQQSDQPKSASRYKNILISMRNAGTAVLGDVSNGPLIHETFPDISVERIVFYELIGFRAAMAESLFAEALKQKQKQLNSIYLTPHGPHTVSPLLIQKIKELEERLSIHVAESLEETELIKKGTGPFRTFLEERGAWDDSWEIPAMSPVEYLDKLGVLSDHSLLVHCVHVTDDDLDIIKSRQAPVCLCPRSNARLKVGEAPVKKMLEKGIPVCFGTDSLASNLDLDVSNELYYLSERQDISNWKLLLTSATLNGAKALGVDEDYGSIDKGKKARLNIFYGKTHTPEKFIIRKEWRDQLCL